MAQSEGLNRIPNPCYNRTPHNRRLLKSQLLISSLLLERSQQVRYQLIHTINPERNRSQMQPLKNHFILRQSACLVREHIRDATEFLGHGTGAHQGAWDILIMLNEPRVNRLSHVNVDTQTDRDNVREEENKAEEISVPWTMETFQGNHDQAQSDYGNEEHFG